MITEMAPPTPTRPAAPRPVTPGGPGQPAYRLPMEHFVAAIVFLLLGGAGLVWIAPHLTAGHFAAREVAAVTHLFTLGWITTSILGALYQFLPVALGVPIRSERHAHVGFIGYVAGLPMFVIGFLTGRHPLMLTGVALFAGALLLFVLNLARTLRRASERNVTWWCLAGAAVFLVATIVLGASLAGNLRWGYIGDNRLLAIGVHLHVALAGWVLLVAIGVAHRLLPMFLLSHDVPTWPAVAAAWLTGSGAGILLALHHYLTPPVLLLVAALLAGGVLAFIGYAATHFRGRKRRVLDAGMSLAAAGVGFLLLGVALAPFVVVHGAGAPRLAIAYVMALVVGGFSLFVAGHQYKIVPFMVWFHRYSSLMGKRKLPVVADLYSAPTARSAGALLALGTALLLIGVLAGNTLIGRSGALLFFAGAAVLGGQLLPLVLRRSHVE